MRSSLLGDPGAGEAAKEQSSSIGKAVFAAIAGSCLVLGCIALFSLPNNSSQPDELLAAPSQLNMPRGATYRATPLWATSALRNPQRCMREVYGCSFQNPGGPLVDKMLTNMRDVSSYAAVGDAFPTVDVDFGFPPTKVNMGERLKGKKTIVVGLPGAFTPV
jgi:outer membrane murein-binding lipoprotein Lpp